MTRDLTRSFGICNVEKAILTFPLHIFLSLQIFPHCITTRGLTKKNLLHSSNQLILLPFTSRRVTYTSGARIKQIYSFLIYFPVFYAL